MRLRPLFLLSVTLLATAPAWPCGPYPYVIRFWNDWQPDDPAAYADGDLGTIGARYGITELWIAYRYLESLPVDPACCSPTPDTMTERFDALQRWTEARARVASESASIDPVRWEESVDADGNRRYEAWDNCLPDAFVTAASTLGRRIADHGVDDPGVREWVTGQDQVFDNCAGGRTIPAEPTTDWPAWLRADREYQIAAAHLYSRGYEEAEQRFRRIAVDAHSPWNDTAHYLVARALARSGRLEAAIAHLRGLLAAPERASWHPAARRLLSHLRFRHEPEVLLQELAERLGAPTPPADPRQDLIDLGRLLRSGMVSDHPLAHFLRAAWLGDLAAAEQAAARTHSADEAKWWLAAALAHARAGAADPWSDLQWPTDGQSRLVATLLADVPPATGPAATAIGYHHLRLLAAAGRLAAGRGVLERLVAVPGSRSDHNRLMTLWRELATDSATYLQRSLMTPVQDGWWYGESGGGLDPADESGARTTLLDPAAVSFFERTSPTDLRTLAQLPVTPPHVAKQLIGVALARAILAGDLTEAQTSAQLLRPHAPELDAAIGAFLGAEPSRQRFLAWALLLEAPGLEPILHGGLGRGSRPSILPLDEIESFGANWWCGTSGVDTDPWTAALTQHAPLAIGPEILAWADAHRDDPEVPRALARLVRATRFSCGRGVGAFAEVSRGAFERLHQRYPKSAWATRTRYWYE